MPISIIPPRTNEPEQPGAEAELAEAAQSAAEPREEPGPRVVRGSRWVDYDTHELLEMISELEDERRWARLREGILWALLFHIALLFGLFIVPKYILKVPQVIDPIDAIKNRKDLNYLDLPPDAIRALQPKTVVKPVPERQSHVDKKTLEAMNRPAPPVPTPTPEPQPTPPVAAQPTPPPPVPSTNQSQLDMPRPAAVPARPNFNLGSQNPADQMRDAMKGASRNPGAGPIGSMGGGGLARHPGAGTGAPEILSDTQGVDFRAWMQRWHHETENTWDPLIPDEVNPPILKSGVVAIRFKVLPNGRLMDGSLVLEGRSGDTALDRAAWGALTGSNYPPLPRDFHGPYLEIRAYFLYNEDPSLR